MALTPKRKQQLVPDDDEPSPEILDLARVIGEIIGRRMARQEAEKRRSETPCPPSERALNYARKPMGD